MNIGIVVHSQTGTTLGFGELIAGKLRERGHTVDLVRLETAGPVKPRDRNVTVTNMPDAQRFDVLLAGCPVWAFSATPVILACIKGMKGLAGKKAIPFTTMGFPCTRMGGTRTIGQMQAALEAAGAQPLPGQIVPKMLRDSKRLMEEAATAIVTALT